MIQTVIAPCKEPLWGRGNLFSNSACRSCSGATVQGKDIYTAADNSPFAYNLGLGNTCHSNPGTNWQTGQTAAAQGSPILASSLDNLAQEYRAPAVAQFSPGIQHEVKPSVI